MILLVTYDLKGPAGSYSSLFEVLKSQNNWWHYLSKTWLVDTDSTPGELFAELKPHLKLPGDRILITPFTRPYQGWLPSKAWKWIHSRED